jgi:hypothetical protein
LASLLSFSFNARAARQFFRQHTFKRTMRA